MPKLGDVVVYKVPDEHRTKTVKNGEEVQGSIHHAERTDFAGIVGAVHPDGTHSVMLLVPNKPPAWVDAVSFGDGPGQFLHPEEANFERRWREWQPHADQAPA